MALLVPNILPAEQLREFQHQQGILDVVGCAQQAQPPLVVLASGVSEWTAAPAVRSVVKDRLVFVIITVCTCIDGQEDIFPLHRLTLSPSLNLKALG